MERCVQSEPLAVEPCMHLQEHFPFLSAPCSNKLGWKPRNGGSGRSTRVRLGVCLPWVSLGEVCVPPWRGGSAGAARAQPHPAPLCPAGSEPTAPAAGLGCPGHTLPPVLRCQDVSEMSQYVCEMSQHAWDVTMCL